LQAALLTPHAARLLVVEYEALLLAGAVTEA
jgi:hypothetical protein